MNKGLLIRRCLSAVLLTCLGSAVATSATESVQTITPNFHNADVRTVIESLRIANKKTTIHPDVSGTLTMSCKLRLSPDAYYKVVSEALRANGFETRDFADELFIGPKRSSGEFGVATHVTSMTAANTANTLSSIRPLLSAHGRVKEIAPGCGILVISDDPNSIEQIRTLLKETDRDYDSQVRSRVPAEAADNPAFQVIRFQAVMMDGRFAGYRAYPGPDRRRFMCLGTQPGDLIIAVDGVALTQSDADSLTVANELQLWATSRANHSIAVYRDGQRVVVQPRCETQ